MKLLLLLHSYNVSLNGYKRFWRDKWKTLGIISDVEYLEGTGIWIRVDKNHNKGILTTQVGSYPSSVSDTQGV